MKRFVQLGLLIILSFENETIFTGMFANLTWKMYLHVATVIILRLIGSFILVCQIPPNSIHCELNPSSSVFENAILGAKKTFYLKNSANIWNACVRLTKHIIKATGKMFSIRNFRAKTRSVFNRKSNKLNVFRPSAIAKTSITMSFLSEKNYKTWH